MSGLPAMTWGRRAMLAALVSLAMAEACASPTGTPVVTGSGVAPAPALQTRAERSGYRETSRYADVVAFLDSLKLRGAPFAFGSIGRTTEGRDIPFVIASRPLVRTPAEAKASGKPIVYVQANIHAGEVEGKEAVQALLRDLAFNRDASSILDSLILIAVPIYNADGNERFGPQETQRTEQNGPALVGQRANARGLDLNRDYVKAEAPETRGSLAMFEAWDPDVFVDLHTTDGSFHGYALTYAPSLHPSAPLGAFTRTLLAEVRTRMRARHALETFDYGNFVDAFSRETSTDTVHTGWSTYDHRPRFGTNYYGLRNRVGILSEAYSHDPFERRVTSTYYFVQELLSLVAERGAELRRRERAIPGAVRDTVPPLVALRSALPREASGQPVRFEVLAATKDSARTQPGVPRGIRRTGIMMLRYMPVFDRFDVVLEQRAAFEYLVGRTDTATVVLLRRHGIHVEPMSRDNSGLAVEMFMVDSVTRATRPFQGHLETRVFGAWTRQDAHASPADWYVVPTRQPLGLLASYLLEPESDDGLATWDVLEHPVARGRYPILRRPGDLPSVQPSRQ